MKKLLIILCCSAIMFSFSKDNDRILEIKALYSKIINDTSYKTDTVSWSVSENEYSSPLARTFVYSYFENNLSKLNCEIKQDHFFISSEYYFKDNVLFFAFLTYDYGSDKEENRLYFNKFGGIEKLLVNYGNGNKEITDIDEINKLKQVTLNWLEKGKANKENREKINEEKLNIQLNDSKVIIEKKSNLEEEKNLIAENDFSWYDRLPLPKWYRNLTLDDKPAPKWLFYWSIFLFIFVLFRNQRKAKKISAQARARTKEKEDQEKQKDKNEKETGFRESNAARAGRESRKEKMKKLTDKYGKEDGEKIFNKKIWVGMTSAMLQDSKGYTDLEKNSEHKQKTKKQNFYGSYKNRQNNIKHKLRVDLENGKVVGFKDL